MAMASATLAAKDARQWIYELTKDKKVGESSALGNGSHNRPNGNFLKELTAKAYVSFDGRAFELLPGTEVVVFRKIEKRAGSNDWAAKSNKALATVFLKEGSRPVRQITVYMNGRIRMRYL